MRINMYCFVLLCALGIFNPIESAQDRRCRFYDLSKIKKEDRKPQSSIIQFYSSSDNIGNYLPILGIQEMLGIVPDVWCIHDKNIDFDFINKHYAGAIIGGAGLLNACFEPFWLKLRDQCTLPMIMWGLGICLPYRHGDAAAGVDKDIVQAVAKKCDLINIRDNLTAQYYQLLDADISPCPTVVYLQKFKSSVNSEGLVLYDSHAVSVGKERTQQIIDVLKKNIPELQVIDNIQKPNFGLEDYIKKYYCKSSVVITSRLHGAIIAYGLGIPCIMIPGDYKINSFQETYGFGTCVSSAKECLELMAQGTIPFGIPLNIASVLAFGKKARQWLDTVTYARSAHFVMPQTFSQAMVSDPHDKKKYKKFLTKTPHKQLLKFIINQYYQFLDSAKQRESVEPIIPKIIHQIWIGPHPFPKEACAWQQSWRSMHPDWEYKLWTNEDVEKLDFDNKKYFDEAQNWGEKADILRYEILHRFGGIYVDVDFECIKSFDWLHHVCDFYAGIHVVPLLLQNKLRINNGLIAARPKHPILKHAIEQIQYYRNEKGVALRTGPDFFTTIIQDTLPQSCASGSLDMIFPSNFFYPSGVTEEVGFTIKPGNVFVMPETLAIHYFTAYWIRPPQQEDMAKSEDSEDKDSIARKRKNERLIARYEQYQQNKQKRNKGDD